MARSSARRRGVGRSAGATRRGTSPAPAAGTRPKRQTTKPADSDSGREAETERSPVGGVELRERDEPKRWQGEGEGLCDEHSELLSPDSSECCRRGTYRPSRGG